MGILETLIVIFLVLFVIGLILSVTIWLVWLSLVIAIVLFVVGLVLKVRKIIKKFVSRTHDSS